MPTFDPRIDEYINKAAGFAQPILSHIRELVHEVCPDVEETIKWGMPHFDYNGSLMLGMASFKQHCALTFHKANLLPDPYGLLVPTEKSGMGHFGKLSGPEDLPSDDILKEYIRDAMRVNQEGKKVKKAAPAAKADIAIPDYFSEALSANPQALATFTDFSPSCKREYLEWITEAKTEATRQKRMASALEWMAEGKQRNWKYQRK